MPGRNVTHLAKKKGRPILDPRSSIRVTGLLHGSNNKPVQTAAGSYTGADTPGQACGDCCHPSSVACSSNKFTPNLRGLTDSWTASFKWLHPLTAPLQPSSSLNIGESHKLNTESIASNGSYYELAAAVNCTLHTNRRFKAQKSYRKQVLPASCPVRLRFKGSQGISKTKGTS